MCSLQAHKDILRHSSTEEEEGVADVTEERASVVDDAKIATAAT